MTNQVFTSRPIVILGCTASGKSSLAEALALKLNCRLMAVDSMQVYRGMNIGTAKPDDATRARISYSMLDVADPWESYSAARFSAEARPMLEKPDPADPRPFILVGGTILYLRALLEGLFEGPSAQPEIRARLNAEAEQGGPQKLHDRLATIDELAASRIHPNDLRRIVRALEVYEVTGQRISDLQTQWNRDHPAIDATFIAIDREREALNRRINARVKAMMAAGLIEEVRKLAADPRGFSKEASDGVGYRQLLDYFAHTCSLDEATEQIKISTRHLAKLQRTWLKRFPNVHWLRAEDHQDGADLVDAAEKIITQ